jgi:hypothetical protein
MVDIKLSADRLGHGSVMISGLGPMVEGNKEKISQK